MRLSAALPVLVLLLLLAALSAAMPHRAHAAPAVVVLVRHAEKGAEPAEDPALSPAGQRRAQALAQAFANGRFEAILTTSWRRTRETARPLALRLDLEPEVVPTRGGGLAAHVQDVVAAVRRHAGPVLVVGHTNTIPAIAQALGAPAMNEICETTFGLALVLVPRPTGTSVLQLRYGEPDPAPAPGCL